jgi:hypothetical protein
VLAAHGAPDPTATASALVAGQGGRLVAGAPVQGQAALADLLGGAYAEALRAVFLTAAGGGVLGALLVLWLVRAPAPVPHAQALPRVSGAAADPAAEPAAG